MALSSSIFALHPFVVIRQVTQSVLSTNKDGYSTGQVEKVYQGCDTVHLNAYVLYKYSDAIPFMNSNTTYYVVHEDNIFLIYTP